ncbi:MAG: diphthine--ammonia ligase [Candidatus Micrarchaeia archaeon]
MKLTVLFSGGKDSVFSAFWAMYQGHEVRLLSLVPESDSMMFHFPNVKYCREQAGAMGVGIDFLHVENRNELAELEAFLSKQAKAGHCEGVVAGAIESEYQKQRIEQICARLGLASFAPLWRTYDSYVSEVTEYFNAVFSRVAAGGLGPEWLGKRFDSGFVRMAKSSRMQINPSLEGGEGETFVLDAPFYSKRLEITSSLVEKDGDSHTLAISQMKAVVKHLKA